jgi:hypothetical protein
MIRSPKLCNRLYVEYEFLHGRLLGRLLLFPCKLAAQTGRDSHIGMIGEEKLGAVT